MPLYAAGTTSTVATAADAGTTQPAKAANGKASGMSLAPRIDDIAAAVRVAALTNAKGVTVSLSPRELGTVEINISRQETGGPAVTLAVERPETLELLRRDAPALQAALDRAGFVVDQRHMTMTLAANASVTTASTASTGGGTMPEPGFGSSANGPASDGRSYSQRAREQRDSPVPSGTQSADVADTLAISSAMTRRNHAGLDITA